MARQCLDADSGGIEQLERLVPLALGDVFVGLRACPERRILLRGILFSWIWNTREPIGGGYWPSAIAPSSSQPLPAAYWRAMARTVAMLRFLPGQLVFLASRWPMMRSGVM